MVLALSLIVACATSTPADPHAEHAATPAAAHPEAVAADAPAAHDDHAAAPVGRAGPDGWTLFGADFALTEAVPAGTLLADPASYVDKPLLVEGRVTQVCQSAGCWLVIADADKSMRVTVKDHAFSVDKEGAGSSARVEGTVVAKPADPNAIAHYKSESENPSEVPEEAMGAMTYTFVASAVAFKKPTEG